VNPVPDIFRILPEVILTLTGVHRDADRRYAAAQDGRAVRWAGSLLSEPRLRSLGQPLAALAASRNRLLLTVETSAFTVFFHVLICGIVLVALLLSLDTLPEDSHHQGEFYALIVFGAVGMCLLTGAVELLVVFIALEISSISTYILAGYRKRRAAGPRRPSSISSSAPLPRHSCCTALR
jgi:NADH-quinone oxidoreductase subunit N